MSGVFITSTNTAAGKTTLGCWLIATLEKNRVGVCVRKPIESGCPIINGQLFAQDAHALASASQRQPHRDEVCPFPFKTVASTARAMKLENRNVGLEMLVKACCCPPNEFLLVEGAGGICSPLTQKALNIDLARRLRLPLIIVCDNKIGALSQTISALESAQKHHVPVVAVIFNETCESPVNDLDNCADLRQWTTAFVAPSMYDKTGRRNRHLTEKLSTKLLDFAPAQP